MNRCNVSLELLLDYREGRSDVEEAGRLREHLAAGCERCTDQLVWIEQNLPALRQALAGLAAAPARALDRARRIARQGMVAPAHRLTVVQLARLVFDSRQSPLVGARGAASGAVRRLYETADYLVDLMEEPEVSGSSYLIGQVHQRADGEPVDAVAAVLAIAGAEPVAARAEGSEFHLPGLTAGTYELKIRIGEAELLIPALILGD